MKLTKDTTDKTATDLKQKRDARWDVVLLSQSQVLCKKVRLRRSVVGEAGKVEVGKRPTWKQVTSQHLANWLNIEAKAGDTVLSTEEESEKEGKTQREKVSPTRQS